MVGPAVSTNSVTDVTPSASIDDVLVRTVDGLSISGVGLGKVGTMLGVIGTRWLFNCSLVDSSSVHGVSFISCMWSTCLFQTLSLAICTSPQALSPRHSHYTTQPLHHTAQLRQLFHLVFHLPPTSPPSCDWVPGICWDANSMAFLMKQQWSRWDFRCPYHLVWGLFSCEFLAWLQEHCLHSSQCLLSA